MELVEKVQELQAIKPPLDIDEINRRIQEWKKSTGYKAPEAIDPVDPIDPKKDGNKEAKKDSSTEKNPNGEQGKSTGLNFGDGPFQYIEPSTGQTEVDYRLFSDETFNRLNPDIIESTSPNFTNFPTIELEEVDIDTSRPFSERNLYKNLGVMVFGDSANPIDQEIIQNKLRTYGEQYNATTLYDLNVQGQLPTQFDESGSFLGFVGTYGGRSSGQSLYQDNTKFNQGLDFIFGNPLGTDIDKVRDYAKFNNNGKPIIALNYGDVTIDVDDVPMTQSQLRSEIVKRERAGENTSSLNKKLEKHGGESFYALDVSLMQDLYIADNMPVYNESELSGQVYDTFENGRNLVDSERLYFLDAEERLNNGDYIPDQEDFLKSIVAKGEKKYGKKFYDDFGRTAYGFKEIQTSGAAVGLAQEHPPGDLTLLKRQLVYNKDKVVVLAQAALDLLKQEQGDYNVTLQGSTSGMFEAASIDGGLFSSQYDFNKGSLLQATKSKNKEISDLAKKQIAYLEKIVSTGQIPTNPGFDIVAEFGLGIGTPVFIKEGINKDQQSKLGYLSGDSEIIRAFNNAMDSYDITNKALQINRNPLARESSTATDIWEGLTEKIFKDFGEDRIIDVEEKQEIANFLENAGAIVRDSNGNYLPEFSEALETSRATNITQGAYDLTKILIQFTYLRRVAGKPIAKISSAAETSIINGLKGSRFSSLNKAGDFLNRTIQGTTIGAPGKLGLIGGIADEAILFEVANMSNHKFGGDEAKYKFGEGLKMGAAISGGGFFGKEGFRAISNVLSKNSVLADVIYKGTVATPLRRGISNSITRSLGGGFAMVNSNLLLDPVGFVKDFEISKYLSHVLDESAILFFAGKTNGALTTKRGRSLQSVKNQVAEEFQYMQGKDPVVITDAAKSLGLDSKVTKQENGAEQIAEAAQKEVDKITKELKDSKITEKEAKAKIDIVSKNALNLTNQSNLNQLKSVIENDPSMPNQGEIYFAVKQLQAGSKINEKNSKIISELGPEYLLDKLGLKNNPTNLNFANQIIFNEKHIQELLNGGGVIYGPEGAMIVGEGKFRANSPKVRTETFNFLRERFALESELQRLQAKSKKGLTETEKNQLEVDIKKTQEDLNSYLEGGEKYEANQKELDVDFETALAKEKDKDTDITITTSQGESTGKFVDVVEFKEIVENDGVEYNERSLAYTARDGNRYINEAAIRKVRKISDPFHERNHTYFLDLILKDSSGLVTKEGMETIDSILETLTPSERAKLDAEVESRYDTSKPKEQWYEENIAVMGELMSGKNPVIKRSKKFTESLEGLLPLAKNRGFENIGDTPTELAGLIAGAARGSKGAEKRLGELAETRAQELKATEEATGEKFTDTASGKPSLSRVVSKEAKELQELLDNRSLVESLKSRSTEDKFSVAQAFVEKNFGLVKDLFNTRSQAEENALKEILEEQILGEFQGSGNGKYSARNTNLFNSYDAAKEVGGAKETTYFRKVLSKRIPEIDIAIKERTGTSPELPNQTKEFAPEPTTEKAKPTASKQLPSEVKMKPEFVENLGIEVKEGQTSEQAIQDALKTQVLDSFKETDINKYKDLKTPRSLAEFYAKMLGIESEAGIKALMIPNRNFPAGEKAAATRAKQFILDNLQAIHSRINTPGFKQTKVGKALLNEKGNLKPGSLKILKDIISGKNITVEGYDGKPIEFNPLENGKPVPLYRRSQPLKVVLSSYFKNNALEYLEGDASQRAKLGAKFSNAKELKVVLKLSERRRLEKELKTIVGQLRTIARDALPKGVELPDLSTIEGRQAYVDFLITDYFPKIMEIFGADAIQVIKSTDVAPGGNRILFTRKDGSKAGALVEGQLGVSDATKKDLVGKYGKEFAKENKELADAGLVFEQKNIKELIPEGEVDPDIEVATRQQKTKDYQRNLDSRQQHKDGFKKVLNKFKEVFDSDPKMMQGMIIHMYNPNANYSFYRNLAQLIGKEIGIEKGWEEHAYQAGNFALRTLQAMTSKNPKTWENWLEWSSEKYVQQTLGKEAVSAIDKNYRKNRYSDANPAPKWLPEFELDGVYASKSAEHPLLKKAIDEAIKTGDFSKVPDPKIRYYNEYLSLNPNLITNKGVTDAKEYNVEVPKEFQLNPNVYKYQGQLIYQQILTKAGILKGNNALTSAKAKELINDRLKSAKAEAKQARANNNSLGKNLKISISEIEASDTSVVTNELKTADAALELSRSLNIEDGKPVPKKEKKARVFDFDDTLARSNSKVLVEMPGPEIDPAMLDVAARRKFRKEFENKPSFQQNFKNLTEAQKLKVLEEFPGTGRTFKINATEFAEKSAQLEKEGAKFDFSEFSKVIDGKKGPLFDVAKTIANKRGTEDLFVLTARPQDAAGPIREFMKALGIDIPLSNITGLADGKASAKGRWIMGKVSEGYNDFYFADDALKNVEAVKEVLDQADVKGKVQQAKFSNAKTFNTITNEMIEASSGIEAYKTFSAAKARTLGENKGRFDWLTMASSAEDFKGLLYKMLGNGKQGEAHFEFLKNNLIDPYNRAEDSAIQAKISAANDFMALKSMYKTIPTTLKKETGVGKFTYQHALRTYMWTKQGMTIPGLSKADVAKLNKFVTDNAELQTFADQLIVSQKGKGYPEPGKNWLAGNLTTDIIGGINKVNRAEYQKTFRENVDIIFSPENLNKMEAAYGTRWRKALEDTLRRMKSGSNRPIGGSEITNKVLDWTNNSVGAVMFLNTRSALLQTISAVNFLNWGDNNPIAAGKAFANQKQFWGDFMTLMNSDYLVQRRNGLKINVSESEIADAVKDSKNKVNAAISYLLSKGFVLTRYADSFAIASGGSTFYRNRIKKYVKEGMDQKLAEQKAFEDFKDVAEESQQSSDASKISMQQASGAGRVILNWANTPMQYVRIQKRAAQDLIAGRGDAKEHISKIAYYGAIQNLIFNSLQQALFAIGFGSDEDEKDPKIKARNEKKITRVANGMIDSQLKGLGIAGNAMVAAKNTVLKIIEESEKKRPEYEKAAIEALSFSPAISSKYRKIVGGLKSFSWNAKEMKEKGFSLDNPAYLAGAQIFTATTNIPLDRVVKKTNNIRGILSEQTAEWQKISLAAGYGTYDIGLPYYGGWDAVADPTPEEIEQRKFDTMRKDTKTQDQIDMLLDLGLTKKEIKALGKEDARVKKIIELQSIIPMRPTEEPKETKTKPTPTPETKPQPKPKPKPKTETAEQKLRRQFDSIKSENKPDQVKTLTGFGLTKKEIRDLRYEKDRVEKILELMDK